MAAQSHIVEKKENPTQKKHSLLTALWVSLIIVAGVLIVFESVSRLSLNKTTQPIRSIGNFHTQFETKWFKLKDFVKENGGVDVFLMGNSMVNTGVDSEILAHEYEARTGISLRIFNFGVEGMDIFTNSELASLLVKEFHPGTIIYFTEMREYGPMTDSEVPDRYKTASWFQYKLGNTSSMEAWIYDHSAALQYFLPFRNWSRADFPDVMLKDLYRYSQTTAAGYEPDRAYGRDLDVRTDPTDPAQKILFDLYREYIPDEEHLTDFASILELQKSGVQVLVTEMPIYKTFYDYFGGESVHQAFLETIEALTLEHRGIFVQPVDSELIPLVGRMDNNHLNFEGAPVYSQLLSAELADLCLAQNQCLSRSEVK